MRRCLLILPIALLTSCGQPFADRSAGPEDPGAAPPVAAYYLVQPQDLRGESSGGQPAPDLTQYGFLVCNADMDPDAVRAAAPQALLFGYVSSHQVPLWGETPFWTEYRAQFDSTDFWLDGAGQRVSTWENTEEMLYTAENAETLASFVLAHWGGWDGIYIDDCFGYLADVTLRQLPIAQGQWSQVQDDWVLFRDAFITALQAGTDQPIVGNAGNSAAHLRHLELEGVCSEEWWPTQSDLIRVEFSRYDPGLCVSWEWDAGSVARPGDIRYR